MIRSLPSFIESPGLSPIVVNKVDHTSWTNDVSLSKARRRKAVRAVAIVRMQELSLAELHPLWFAPEILHFALENHLHYFPLAL
jgi:hypothetical protein